MSRVRVKLIGFGPRDCFISTTPPRRGGEYVPEAWLSRKCSRTEKPTRASTRMALISMEEFDRKFYSLHNKGVASRSRARHPVPLELSSSEVADHNSSRRISNDCEALINALVRPGPNLMCLQKQSTQGKILPSTGDRIPGQVRRDAAFGPVSQGTFHLWANATSSMHERVPLGRSWLFFPPSIAIRTNKGIQGRPITTEMYRQDEQAIFVCAVMMDLPLPLRVVGEERSRVRRPLLTHYCQS